MSQTSVEEQMAALRRRTSELEGQLTDGQRAGGRIGRRLEAVRQVNRLLAGESAHGEWAESVCRLLVESESLRGAWLILRGHGEPICAQQGIEPEAFAELTRRCRQGELPICCRDEQGCFTTRDDTADCGHCPLAAARGDGIAFTAPLTCDGTTYGHMGLVLPPDSKTGPEELAEVTEQLAAVLHAARREQDRQQLLRQLEERMKEQECLATVADLTTREELSEAELLQQVVACLPSGWQYPEVAVARVACGDITAATADFRQTPWRLSAPIETESVQFGLLEVAYLEERPAEHEGPFLHEERQLLEGVALRLAQTLQRRRDQQLLAVQRARLLAVLDGIEDVIYVADPDTYELLHVNETFRKIWGDHLGEKCYRVLQNRDTPCSFCTNHLIFGEHVGQTHVWEFQNEVTKRWYRCADRAIRWPDGRWVRFELASDITAQKQTEESLRRYSREQELRSRIGDAFLTADDDRMYGEVLDILREAFASPYGVFGYLDEHGDLVVPTMTRDVWSQCRVPDKQIVFPRSIWGCSSWVRALAEQTPNHNNEPSTGIPEGHVPITRHVSLPIVHGGESLGVIQLANKETDYTEEDRTLLAQIAEAIAPVLGARLQGQREERRRQAAEQDLRERTAELERSNRELEQFAYVASHDLQEPLRMVSSYTQLLAEEYRDELDDEARKWMDYAVDGASRMQRLIQDLLAYSRVTTRGQELTPVSSRQALGIALGDLQMALRDAGAEVEHEDLPEVMADPGQLVQVFQNLVGNAIKFRGERAPHVRISAQPGEGDTWQFSVADNGIGIDPRFADKVFVIFQRLHTRRAHPGTGIGLAIVKRIVERHGGKIWFDSEPGAGTTFHFTLPKPQAVKANPHGSN